MSTEWYEQNRENLPKLHEDGLEIARRAGSIEITDLATKALVLGLDSILSGLDEEQGRDLALPPKRGLGRCNDTTLLLWHFGMENLKEWMSEQLGEELRHLWLGEKHRGNGLVKIEAGGEVLECERVGLWE